MNPETAHEVTYYGGPKNGETGLWDGNTPVVDCVEPLALTCSTYDFDPERFADDLMKQPRHRYMLDDNDHSRVNFVETLPGE